MDNQKIIEKIKSGDKNAFDILFEEYHIMLFRTALLILGNVQDAEDTCQETFVSIYMNIDSLKEVDKLKPLMFSILKNSAYKKYKNKKREFPDENIIFKLDNKVSENGEEEFAVKSDLIDSLMKLSPKHREVIVLFYYNDLSIKEIAEVLNVFEGTVKSRLYIARRKLKKELERTDENFLTEGEGAYEKRLEKWLW